MFCPFISNSYQGLLGTVQADCIGELLYATRVSAEKCLLINSFGFSIQRLADLNDVNIVSRLILMKSGQSFNLGQTATPIMLVDHVAKVVKNLRIRSHANKNALPAVVASHLNNKN